MWKGSTQAKGRGSRNKIPYLMHAWAAQMFLYQQLFCLAWGFHRALESHKCGVRSRWQSPDPNPSLPPLEETRGRSHVHSSTEEMSWERGSAGIWGCWAPPALPQSSQVIKNWVGSAPWCSWVLGVEFIPCRQLEMHNIWGHCTVWRLEKWITIIGMVSAHNPWLVAQFRPWA